MADSGLLDIVKTCELRSQSGVWPMDDMGFEGAINSYLDLGWRIINTYVEDKGPESTREECVVLLGWPNGKAPKYPQWTND